MKSLYVKPETKVIYTEVQSLLAASVAVDMDKVETKNEGSMDARGNRGTWGDLWN